MECAIEFAIARSRFPESFRLATRTFARSAARVLCKRAGRFESLDVADFSDDLGGDDDAASRGGVQALAALCNKNLKIFLDLDDFFAQLLQSFHSTFRARHEDRLSV